MIASFAEHVALLDHLLRHRGDVVGRLERQLLNVRDKPIARSRDRRVFERVLHAAVFGEPSLPPALRRLDGDLDARHVADGFEPVVIGRHVHDLDPLDLVLRAYEHWDATRWPGASGRLSYAGTLYSVWMTKRIGHLTLRIWDDGEESAGARLDDLQQRLDCLNAFTAEDVMVRDVRWLLQTTLGPFTRHLEPYLVVADRVERSLPLSRRMGIHEAGATLAGGHLRSQLRYRAEEASRSIDDIDNLAITRSSNSLDSALLVGDLVPLLEAYRTACLAADEARRLDLADAILQGVSSDPDLFLVRWDLLAPGTIVETACITRDPGGDRRLCYTPIGARHMERLRRYRALVGELATRLRDDAATLAPVPGTYSPYGVSYGFITDVLANMAVARLVGQPSPGLSLEDAFRSRDRLDDKLARARAWQRLPTRPDEQEHFSHTDEWAARMHARLVDALDARAHRPAALNASNVRDARIVLASGADDVASDPDVVRADEFCLVTDAARSARSGAVVCAEAELLTDRAEGRLLASAGADGQWFGVPKVLLTLVLARGQDARLSDVPEAVADVLAFAYPELVTGRSG